MKGLLYFDGEFFEPFVQHFLGDDTLYGVGHCIQHPFPDEVVPDDDRDLPHGRRIVDRAYVATLFFGQQGDMKFRNYGIPPVAVDDLHQRVDAARFVSLFGTGPFVAEIEHLIADAVPLLQHPEPVERHVGGR